MFSRRLVGVLVLIVLLDGACPTTSNERGTAPAIAVASSEIGEPESTENPDHHPQIVDHFASTEEGFARSASNNRLKNICSDLIGCGCDDSSKPKVVTCDCEKADTSASPRTLRFSSYTIPETVKYIHIGHCNAVRLDSRFLYRLSLKELSIRSVSELQIDDMVLKSIDQLEINDVGMFSMEKTALEDVVSNDVKFTNVNFSAETTDFKPKVVKFNFEFVRSTLPPNFTVSLLESNRYCDFFSFNNCRLPADLSMNIKADKVSITDNTVEGLPRKQRLVVEARSSFIAKNNYHQRTRLPDVHSESPPSINFTLFSHTSLNSSKQWLESFRLLAPRDSTSDDEHDDCHQTGDTHLETACPNYEAFQEYLETELPLLRLAHSSGLAYNCPAPALLFIPILLGITRS